jgi:hypothetical protein
MGNVRKRFHKGSKELVRERLQGIHSVDVNGILLMAKGLLQRRLDYTALPEEGLSESHAATDRGCGIGSVSSSGIGREHASQEPAFGQPGAAGGPSSEYAAAGGAVRRRSSHQFATDMRGSGTARGIDYTGSFVHYRSERA